MGIFYCLKSLMEHEAMNKINSFFKNWKSHEGVTTIKQIEAHFGSIVLSLEKAGSVIVQPPVDKLWFSIALLDTKIDRKVENWHLEKMKIAAFNASINPQGRALKASYLEDCMSIHVFFDPSFLNEFAEEMGCKIDASKVYPIHGIHNQQFSAVAKSILMPLFAPDMQSLRLDETMQGALRYICDMYDIKSCFYGARMSKPQLQRVCEYIDENISEKLTVEDLAQVARQNRTALSTKFKNTVGMTPHKFIIQRRIARAEDLLRNSKHTITEISAICGFSDLAHFCHVFKRCHGVSPQQFNKE